MKKIVIGAALCVGLSAAPALASYGDWQTTATRARYAVEKTFTDVPGTVRCRGLDRQYYDRSAWWYNYSVCAGVDANDGRMKCVKVYPIGARHYNFAWISCP